MPTLLGNYDVNNQDVWGMKNVPPIDRRVIHRGGMRTKPHDSGRTVGHSQWHKNKPGISAQASGREARRYYPPVAVYLGAGT
jgi:hypothetical protein